MYLQLWLHMLFLICDHFLLILCQLALGNWPRIGKLEKDGLMDGFRLYTYNEIAGQYEPSTEGLTTSAGILLCINNKYLSTDKSLQSEKKENC